MNTLLPDVCYSLISSIFSFMAQRITVYIITDDILDMLKNSVIISVFQMVR